MFRIKYFAIVFFFIWASHVHAQSITYRDSLLKVLASEKSDTARVRLYLEIGNYYELSDFDSASIYYSKAGVLSDQINYKWGKLKFITNYTSVLNAKGQFDSSMILNKKSIRLATDIGDDIMIGKTWANTGNVFNYMSVYDSASYFYEKAIQYFEKANDTLLLARMYDLLQLLAEKLRSPTKGIALGKKAVNILEKTNEEMFLGQALLNLGNNYQSADYADSAISCYTKALKIGEKTDYKLLSIATLLGMGNIYFHQYNADKMKPYFDKALIYGKEINLEESIQNAHRGLALYYLLKSNLVAAQSHIDSALTITHHLDLKNDHVENLKILASILFSEHRMIEAEKILDSTSKMENSLINEDIINHTLTLEKKFETEKKESQIRLQQIELQRKSVFNYFLIATAFALLLILLLLFINFNHRQKLQQTRINELETEKQLTATEAVLKGEEQERARLAKDLHDGLGGMLSGIKYSLGNMKENLIITPENAQAFERCVDMLDSSIQEMRRVAHNMMPEVLVKYGLDIALKEFCNEISQSGIIHINYQPIDINSVSFDQTTSITIYRIVQELVNNAVKHADAKNLLVQAQVSERGRLFTLTVEDDGRGFDKTTLNHASGIGWSNIRNRVDFLKGKMDIQSSPENGTSVLIEMNVGNSK